jgi:hypothetical protein
MIAKRKPKKSSLPSLIAKADKLASLHVRQKAADENGMVKCVSCPTILHWKEMHSAHFIGRSKKATRWLEENQHPACPSCNVYRKEYHMREYTLWMLEFYGYAFVEYLRCQEKLVLSPSEVRRLAEEAIEEFAA